MGPGPDPQTGTPSSSRESVQKPQARAAPAGWADRSESGQPQDHLLRRRLTKAPSREARRAVPEAETETPGPRQPAPSQTTGTGSSARPLARLYPTTQLLESTALAHCRASHKFTWSCFVVAAAWGQTLTHGGRRHVWKSLKCPPGGPHTPGEEPSGCSEAQGGGKHFCFLGVRKNSLKE